MSPKLVFNLFMFAVLTLSGTSFASINYHSPLDSIQRYGSFDTPSEQQKPPLLFIKNVGQLDKRIHFYAQSNGIITFLTKEGVYFMPVGAGLDEIVLLHAVAGNGAVNLVGLGEIPGKVHFLNSEEPDQSYQNIPLYHSVLYENIFEGIDFLIYGLNGVLEYDLIVKPRAELNRIRFAYENIDNLVINSQGALEVTVGVHGKLLQKQPVIYQEIEGRKVMVNGGFVIYQHRQSDSPRSTYSYGFGIAAYDKHYPLIIDPVLRYKRHLLQ